MFERNVIGLDVGSWAVKAAVLRAGLRGAEFVRFAQARLSQDVATEDREAELFSFLREQQLPLDSVIAALPSHRLTQRHLRFPFRDPKKVSQAIPFELEEDLPVPLSSLLVVHEQALAQPDQTDVLAIACPRREVGDRLNELSQAGLEPHLLEAEGAVLANLSTTLELADAGRLLLDIGHRKTTACLLVDGRPVLLRSIPLAGAHLTRDVARDLRIELEAAEARKHADGLFEGTSTKPLGASVRATLDRLSREVLRSIQAVVGDPLNAIAPTQLVLMGGTAQAPRLDAYLGERLGLPCSVLRVPEGAAGMAALGRAGPAVYAHAAALALRGAPTARVTHSDFRQQEFSYKADLSDLRRGIGLATGLAVLALVLWIGSLLAGLYAADRRAEALHASLAALVEHAYPGTPPDDEPFATLEARVLETRDLADHLGVTHTGLSALQVLRDLSQTLPKEVGVVMTELNVEPRTIQARGFAVDFETAGRVRAELQKLEWVEEVRLTDVISDARRGGKSFNLAIRVREAP
jgi:general secretion pathway protein L